MYHVHKAGLLCISPYQSKCPLCTCAWERCYASLCNGIMVVECNVPVVLEIWPCLGIATILWISANQCGENYILSIHRLFEGFTFACMQQQCHRVTLFGWWLVDGAPDIYLILWDFLQSPDRTAFAKKDKNFQRWRIGRGGGGLQTPHFQTVAILSMWSPLVAMHWSCACLLLIQLH